MNDTIDPLLLADAVSGLVHRLNNSLNAIVLQTAVLQCKVPEGLREELAPIRQEAIEAARLLHPLMALREQRQAPAGPVDLAAILREVAADHPELEVRIDSGDAATAPIAAAGDTVKRLLFLLLRLSRQAAEAGPILVKVTTEQRRIHMEIGPPRAASWVEEAAVAGQPTDELARLAVQALTSLLHGRLDRAQNGCLGLSFGAPAAPA